MARIVLNVGSSGNDGTGDTFRSAANSINVMTNELYNNVASLSSNVTSLTSNVTAIAANVVTINTGVTSVTSNVTSIGANVTSIGANLVTINSNIATLSSNVSNLAVTTNTLMISAPNKPIANNYYPASKFSSMNVGTTPGAGVIYLTPIFIRFTATISSIATWISTLQAGQNFAFALYANDPTTRKPTGNVVATTSFTNSTAATGAIECALTSNYQITPGIWWVAFCTSSTSAVWQNGIVNNAFNSHAFLYGDPDITKVINSSTVMVQNFSYAGTFGTWPDLTGATLSTNFTTKGAAAYFKYISVP